MLSGASWWSPYETEKLLSALTPNLLSADLAAAMAATLLLTVLRPNSLSTFLWQLLDMLVVVESTLSGDTTGAVLTVCLGRTWCGMVKPLPVSPTMAGTSAAVILVIRLSRTTRATVGMVDTSLLAAATGSMKGGEPVLVVCFHRMLRPGSTAATFTDTLSFISSSTPRIASSSAEIPRLVFSTCMLMSQLVLIDAFCLPMHAADSISAMALTACMTAVILAVSVDITEATSAMTVGMTVVSVGMTAVMVGMMSVTVGMTAVTVGMTAVTVCMTAVTVGMTAVTEVYCKNTVFSGGSTRSLRDNSSSVASSSHMDSPLAMNSR